MKIQIHTHTPKYALYSLSVSLCLSVSVISLSLLFLYLSISLYTNVYPSIYTYHFYLCFSKYFLLFYGLTFLFSNSVFQRAEIINFDQVQFINFYFMVDSFVSYLRKLCLTLGHWTFSYAFL